MSLERVQCFYNFYAFEYLISKIQGKITADSAQIEGQKLAK